MQHEAAKDCTPPVDPGDLEHADLVEIVRHVQWSLYLDKDRQGEFWSREKRIAPAPVLLHVADVLRRHGLEPGST